MNVEDRLRGALSTRAGQITADRLRPSAPPTARVPQRAVVRWLPMFAAAAAVAAVFVLFAVLVAERRPSDLPGGPPEPVPATSETPAKVPGKPYELPGKTTPGLQDPGLQDPGTAEYPPGKPSLGDGVKFPIGTGVIPATIP